MESTRDIEPTISLDNVSKSFITQNSAINVIKNISIDVMKNEFVVIFGPGQSGKTTLVKMIAGLESNEDDSIIVNGETVNGPNPNIGMVYQTMALFPFLSVMDNVRFGPRAMGLKKKEQKKIAQKYIDSVGLSGFEDQYPNQLSGGMKQRVGIARAYSNEPEVLLMDEPFGHLDAQTRYLMEDELIRIWESNKKTVVFITNDIEEALYLGDRIILLTNMPSEIKEEYIVDLPRPRDRTTTEFLKLREEINQNIDETL